jgi:hypothetical protein
MISSSVMSSTCFTAMRLPLSSFQPMRALVQKIAAAVDPLAFPIAFSKRDFTTWAFAVTAPTASSALKYFLSVANLIGLPLDL